MTEHEFLALFETFQTDAYRLETLPEYSIPGERANNVRYDEGGYLPDPPQPTEWTTEIAEKVAAGRRHQLVRLVTEPLTMYLRRGVDWSYPNQAAAGREIRIITPDSPVAELTRTTGDYWMFDSRTVALMHYGPDGQFLRPELVTDPATVERHVELRDQMWEQAMTFSAWLAEWRRRAR